MVNSNIDWHLYHNIFCNIFDLPPDNGVEVVSGDLVVIGKTVVPSPNKRK